MTELIEKTDEYVAMFGEPVPVYELPQMSDEALLRLINKALETGKPIETSDNVTNDY